MENSQLQNPTDQYDFELPKELIAQFPLENREDARLMLVERKSGEISHFHIRDLPSILRSSDCLIRNDSRVIPAKLNGMRAKTGGRWTGLFLEEDDSGSWRLLAKTRGKVGQGEIIRLFDRDGKEAAQLTMLTKLEGGSWAAKCSLDKPAFEILEQIGAVPLPHYIRDGNMVDDDFHRYQTVYAKSKGSIAAPTAGLHFTESLIATLQKQGICIANVTLHVGIGTFRPITADAVESHQMHSENGSIDKETVRLIKECRDNQGRVIAVGTTSVRVLETVANQSGTADLMQPWTGSTDIFIRPPYDFKCIDGLLTNFHLPRSTLLVLVRTFGGDELMRRAYEIAVEEKYRFFSYGDAMLIV